MSPQPTLGMVAPMLNPAGLPECIPLTEHAALDDCDHFHQWFADTSGVNLRYDTTIELEYDDDASLYRFVDSHFFPLDGLLFNEWTETQHGRHNFFFTTHLQLMFAYHGGEVFEFQGDDDVWVFVNKKLVLDLGGVHPIVTGSIAMDNVGLLAGMHYRMDIFHAERQPYASNFGFTTTLTVADCIPETVPSVHVTLTGLERDLDVDALRDHVAAFLGLDGSYITVVLQDERLTATLTIYDRPVHATDATAQQIDLHEISSRLHAIAYDEVVYWDAVRIHNNRTSTSQGPSDTGAVVGVSVGSVAVILCMCFLWKVGLRNVACRRSKQFA